jgi:fibronectin-binding autotransporter adhesin
MNLPRALWTNIWPAAFVALAATAVLNPQSADATVYTWKDTGSAWNTGTNWVGNVVPVSSATNSLLFNGAGSTTNNNIGGTFVQGSLDFGASAGSYTVTGNTIRLGGVSNSSTSTQTLNLGINQVNAGTYNTAGTVVVGGALSGTAAITKTGTGTLEFTTSGKSYSGTLTATDGTVRFSTSGIAGNLILENATDFASTGNSNVKDFTATGSGDITVGEAGIGTLNTNNFDLNGYTGTVAVNSAAQATLDRVATIGTNTFGGNLAISLDYTPSNFDRLLGGEFWDFFTAATSTGNFDTVSLTVGGNTYSLANSNGIWTTTGQLTGFGPMEGFLFSTVDTTLTIGGQTVSVAAGTLYAVPEPSTIVFAGIGAAMFGWSTWTRRRAKARRQAIEASVA